MAIGKDMNLSKEEQKIVGLGIKHGDPFECPTCGAPGKIDLDTPPGESPEFELSVWYNRHEQSWECSDCWLK